MPQIPLQEIQNSRVLVRVAFDLPSLSDIRRVIDSSKTIELLLKNNNQIILVTKWGKPKELEQNLSTQNLLPVVKQVLEKELNLTLDLQYLDQFQSFENFNKEIRENPNTIFLLENAHFDPSEKSKDSSIRLKLAQKYSQLADYFVDECFASSHRTEATNTEIKQLFPWCYGLSYQNEIKNLDLIKYNPKKPFVVIMAGSKLETKLPIITKILPLCDQLLIAGRLCFTFIAASKELGIEKYCDVDFGRSDVENSFLEEAKLLLGQYRDKIILPTDFVYGDQNGELITDKNTREKYALDIGKNSIQEFITSLKLAQTVFWNGTIGYYEKEIFNQGNTKIAAFLVAQKDIYKVLGGGDTVSSIDPEIVKKINFVSMGGGASLDYLSKS